MEAFVDYMLTKQGLADALLAILATREGLRLHSREALGNAVTTLLAAGISAGDVRADASTNDASWHSAASPSSVATSTSATSPRV